MDGAILKLFANEERLRFSQIQKALGIRSNNLAYHLERMIRDGRLEKDEVYYRLTKSAERWLPLISSDDVQIPVILVYAKDGDKTLLLRRDKRPYKDLWGLPGGKLLHAETYAQASERILKKTGLEGAYARTSHIMHERITQEGVVKNAFLLIVCEVSITRGALKDTCAWSNSKEQMIRSDRWLLEHLDEGQLSQAEYKEDLDELIVSLS